MDNFIEEIDGWTIKISLDEDCENPREWRYDTVMVCFHKRYNLGDENDYRMEDYNSWDELEQAIIKNEKPAVCLPLYLYDHSGITISTTPFGDKWDSGQVGFIFKRKEDVREAYGVKNVSKKLIALVTDMMVGEVKDYDAYLRGEVYMYEIYDSEGIQDSVGTWYSDFDECKNDAEAYVLSKRKINDNGSEKS